MPLVGSSRQGLPYHSAVAQAIQWNALCVFYALLKLLAKLRQVAPLRNADPLSANVKIKYNLKCFGMGIFI